MVRVCFLAIMAGLLLEVHGLAVEIMQKKTGKQQGMDSGGRRSENKVGDVGQAVNQQAWSLTPGPKVILHSKICVYYQTFIVLAIKMWL